MQPRPTPVRAERTCTAGHLPAVWRRGARLLRATLGLMFLWSACREIHEAPVAIPAPASAPTVTPAVPAAGEQPTLLQGPRLRADDTLWDWGVATAGEELRHVFVLHNDGDTPVHIRKARPT